MDYSPIASCYHLIETVTMGRALQAARTCQLSRLVQLKSIRHALLIGEGDGSFLIAFAAQFLNAQITVVEHSGAMIQRAKERFAKAGFSSQRVSFIQSDLLQCELPNTHFDFVTTLFFLDNFDDATVRRCMDHIRPALTEDAHWLVSDFYIPASRCLRWRAIIWLKVLYQFFRLTTEIDTDTLPTIQACFHEGPFELINCKNLCGQMLFSALYQYTTDSKNS